MSLQGCVHTQESKKKVEVDGALNSKWKKNVISFEAETLLHRVNSKQASLLVDTTNEVKKMSQKKNHFSSGGQVGDLS